MRAHGPHALDVVPQRRPSHLHLDGAKAAPEVVVRLLHERVEREIEIDAARVARHARIVAAEQPPQRRALPPRAQIPQRDVHCGDGKRGEAAPAAVVERPPHRLPQLLDALRLAAAQTRREIARDQRVHGRAAAADRVRVPDALGALRVAHASGDELEALDGAVGAVRKRRRQRNDVVVRANLADEHASPLLEWAQSSIVLYTTRR